MGIVDIFIPRVCSAERCGKMVSVVSRLYGEYREYRQCPYFKESVDKDYCTKYGEEVERIPHTGKGLRSERCRGE